VSTWLTFLYRKSESRYLVSYIEKVTPNLKPEFWLLPHRRFCGATKG
jgi:hypothetical protein